MQHVAFDGFARHCYGFARFLGNASPTGKFSKEVILIHTCGEPANVSSLGPGLAAKGIQISRLPKFGRNDHSYAWALSPHDGALVAPLPDNALVF